MKERHVGSDVVLEQFVEHAVVVIESLGIGCTSAVGKYARPRDREAIDTYPEILEKLNVFFVKMVRIVGDVAGIALESLARSVREGVPNGRLAPVFGYRAFDLVGGGGASPEKSFGKFEQLGLTDFGESLLPGERGGDGGCRGCAGEGLSELATSEVFHLPKSLPLLCHLLCSFLAFHF